MRSFPPFLPMAMLLVAFAAACGAPPRPPASAAQPASGVPRYTDADVRFMQGMIAHHAQALVMTDLVPERSTRRDLRLVAERIAASQGSEIERMQQWLRARGEEVPEPAAHSTHAPAGGMHALMPGMLTPEQLARLAGATGAAFDSLFLGSMIRHHEGALLMVGELFAAPGAGQEPAMYQFASDIDADQRMEIERMRRLQSITAAGARPR